MKRVGVFFVVMMLAAVLDLAQGFEAWGQPEGIVQIGNETLPAVFEGVYDPDGKLISYRFQVQGSHGSIRGDLRVGPPVNEAASAISRQNGQARCVSIPIGPFSANLTKSDSDPVTVQFLLEPMLDLPSSIPAGPTITAFQSVSGSMIPEEPGISITVEPLPGAALVQWHLGPPDTAINPGVGEGGNCVGADPCPYGPFSDAQPAPSGPWTQYGYGYAFTMTGDEGDEFEFTSNLTLEVCYHLGVPAFSQKGSILSPVLFLLCALGVLYWRKRSA